MAEGGRISHCKCSVSTERNKWLQHLIQISISCVSILNVDEHLNEPRKNTCYIESFVTVSSVLFWLQMLSHNRNSSRNGSSLQSEPLHDAALVRITDVSVAGNKRLQLSYFSAELKDVISGEPCTLGELTSKLHGCTQTMLSSNIFEIVDANLDIHSRDSRNGLPEFQAQLQLNVEEKGIPFLKMSSYVKSSSASASDVGFEVQGALRSPLGVGEIVKVSSVTGQSGSHEFSANLTVPHVTSHRLQLDVAARVSEETQHTFHTGYRRAVEGLTVELTDRRRRHSLTAEYTLRDEVPQWRQQSAIPINKPAIEDEAAADTAAAAAAVGKAWGPKAFLESLGFSSKQTAMQTTATDPSPAATPRANVSSTTQATSDVSLANSTAAREFDREINIAAQSLGRVADASAITMQTAAASVKSSLKYSYTLLDTRQSNACSPHQGSFLQGSAEVALPPG